MVYMVKGNDGMRSKEEARDDVPVPSVAVCILLLQVINDQQQTLAGFSRWANGNKPPPWGIYTCIHSGFAEVQYQEL